MFYWKTKAGKEIPIVELEDQHLINIISMLERQGEHAKFKEYEGAVAALK